MFENQKEAKLADERAGKANERAGKLEKEAANTRAQTALLEQSTTELKKQNLETEARLTAANQTLENERQKRLDMELALMPRMLPLKTYTDGTTNVDDLKAIFPIEVILKYVPEFEARKAALNLEFLFKGAGWTVKSSVTERSVQDGVCVAFFNPPSPSTEETREEWGHSASAARTALAVLRLNGWKADEMCVSDGIVKAGQVLVMVGLKPNPYLPDFWVNSGPGKETREKWAEETREEDMRLAPNANPNKPIRLEGFPNPEQHGETEP